MNHPGSVRASTTVVLLAGVTLIAWASMSRAKDEPEVVAPAKDDSPAAAATDFAGKYLADGIGNGGRPYRAMVEIRREGDTYQVVWVLGPRETYSGVGLVEGNTLSVGWASGDTPGVILYTSANDKLVGRWTAPGAGGKTFKETLTPVK
jgi:hypothetical protein